MLLRTLFLLASLSILTWAQEVTTCASCDDVGTLPCPRHKQDEFEVEDRHSYCSHVLACATCRGAMRVDCDDCALGDGDAERRAADNQRWYDAKQDYFDKIGTDDFVIGQSDHFLLFWNGGSINAKGGRLSEHGALHLYLDRLEQLYEDFKVATGADDGAFSTTFLVMVWDRPKWHRNASMHFCSQPEPNTGVKRMGAVGIYSVFLDPAEVDPDESHGADLYRNILHNVSHLLLANAWNAIWPSDMQGGWIDAGVAHYFEDRLDQRCTNFCYVEQDTHASYKGGRWRSAVKKLARAKDRPSFVETTNKRTTQLTPEEHALVWSYCDFLISRNPKGFGALCRSIKEGKGYRDALKQHFDLTPLTLEDEWKEYVKSYRGR